MESYETEAHSRLRRKMFGAQEEAIAYLLDVVKDGGADPDTRVSAAASLLAGSIMEIEHQTRRLESVTDLLAERDANTCDDGTHTWTEHTGDGSCSCGFTGTKACWHRHLTVVGADNGGG